MTPLEQYHLKRKPELDPPPPRRMPSIAARAKNAAKAAGRVVEALMEGQPVLVKGDEAVQRLAICRACSWWRPDAYSGTGGCGHGQCGCSVLKVGFATEACPEGRWTA